MDRIYIVDSKLNKLAIVNGFDFTLILVMLIPWVGLVAYYLFMLILIYQMFVFKRLYDKQKGNIELQYEVELMNTQKVKESSKTKSGTK